MDRSACFLIVLVWLAVRSATTSTRSTSDKEMLRRELEENIDAVQMMITSRSSGATKMSQHATTSKPAATKMQLAPELLYLLNVRPWSLSEPLLTFNVDYHESLGEAIKNSSTQLDREDLPIQFGISKPGLDNCLNVLRTKCSAREFQEENINCTSYKKSRGYPFLIHEDQATCMLCNGTTEAKAAKIVSHCRGRIGLEYLVFVILSVTLLILLLTGGVSMLCMRLWRSHHNLERIAKKAHDQDFKHDSYRQGSMPLRTAWAEQPASDSTTSHICGPVGTEPTTTALKSGRGRSIEGPKSVKFSENV